MASCKILSSNGKTADLTGNVYRGRVTNILHNIQSAFIDINEGENGFIHISDILENTQKFQEMFDMDFEFEMKESRKKQRETDISKILKPTSRFSSRWSKSRSAQKELASLRTFRLQDDISFCCPTLLTAASRAKSKIGRQRPA